MQSYVCLNNYSQRTRMCEAQPPLQRSESAYSNWQRPKGYVNRSRETNKSFRLVGRPEGSAGLMELTAIPGDESVAQ